MVGVRLAGESLNDFALICASNVKIVDQVVVALLLRVTLTEGKHPFRVVTNGHDLLTALLVIGQF